MVGTAEGGSTVRIYSVPDCTGTPRGTGSAAAFAAGGIPSTTVPNNTATNFYTALFGWKTKVSHGNGFPYTHWQNDGADIGGMMAIMPQMGPMPPCWVNYIQVKNCDETAAKATSLAGKVVMPPTDIPNTGRFAMVQDPQGAMFSVIALAPMHKG